MLNEIIDDTNSRRTFVEILLNRRIDLKIVSIFFIHQNERNRYLERVILVYKGRPVLCNYTELILFMEELALFDRGDSFNTYFDVVKEIDKSNSNANPTHLRLDASSIIMIMSRSMAKSIVKIWEMYLRGFSMSNLLENSHYMNIKECSQMLVSFGYLSHVQYESMGFDLEELF
jgi:hypothetical protein